MPAIPAPSLSSRWKWRIAAELAGRSVQPYLLSNEPPVLITTIPQRHEAPLVLKSRHADVASEPAAVRLWRIVAHQSGRMPLVVTRCDPILPTRHNGTRPRSAR